MFITDLQCEGLVDAAQVDTASPRFSWRISTRNDSKRHVAQAGCQLCIEEATAVGVAVGKRLQTDWLETKASQWVMIPGFVPKARSSYQWRVRVRDERGEVSKWSGWHRFGTGLLGQKWPADWIGDGRVLPKAKAAPARHFRYRFAIKSTPIRARLYFSALGIVEPWLNGRKVSDDLFVPGWPDYRRRVFYVAYDVTHLLKVGSNTLGFVLGDGWYSGTLIPGHQFGQSAMVSAFVDLVFANGESRTIGTNSDWQWTDKGPITMNSIYDGEDYDARRELLDWCKPRLSLKGQLWKQVVVRNGWYNETLPVAFTARLAPPVRRADTVKAISVKRMGSKKHLYDFGQNFAGWIRLRVQAPTGTKIRMRFAEMLEADGGIHTANLRTARATATYVTKGRATEEWEPRFTYFGFRYVEVTGVADPLPDSITGIVLHADLGLTGHFECSDELLNRLWQNTLWGQRSNFLEVPTDCPQRDERVGWTGDAQIFAETGLYNMRAGNFFRQWLYSVRDGFRDDAAGGYPDIAPFTGFYHGNAGWAEAGVIVPFAVWLHTGDKRVLSENLPAIQHALELMAAQSPDGIRRSPPGYGDWLAPGFAVFKAPPRYDLIATAYLAHAAELAAQVADVLGRPELASSNRALRDRTRAAFQSAFLAADGRMIDDVQTSYLLALAFDLVPIEMRAKVSLHLVRTIEEKDNHLATGFLGTPLILPVLSSIGRSDLAYKVLKQTTYPGWLYTVKNGATTVWERWDSWTPEHGFHNDGMNSFNHYAYGSVVSWFYGTIAGLQPQPEAPGWKRFRIAPTIGGGLSYASARVVTPYGVASSSWNLGDGRFRLAVSIPHNTDAEVILPVRDPVDVQFDGAPLVTSIGTEIEREPDGHLAINLPSGHYKFDCVHCTKQRLDSLKAETVPAK